MLNHYADHNSALEALLSALDNLDTMFGVIDEKYQKSLKDDEYRKWDEPS
jgi:DNA-directed RNA polymerases I and III subunit RPAC2